MINPGYPQRWPGLIIYSKSYRFALLVDAVGLFDNNVTVHIQIIIFFSPTVRPADFQAIDMSVSSEAEVHSWVVVREVTGGPLINCHLPVLAGINRHLGTDRRSRATIAQEHHTEPMVFVAVVVSE